MARYCCSRCGAPFSFIAVVMTVWPASFRCARCHQAVQLRGGRGWLVFLMLAVAILLPGFWMAAQRYPLFDTALWLLFLGLLAEWLYYRALVTGWIGTSLVPETEVRYPELFPILEQGAIRQLRIPAGWALSADAQGYRLCAPDNTQCLYIDYRPSRQAGMAQEWVDETRRLLLATRYRPTVNHFTVMNEMHHLEDGAASFLLDGFDQAMGYRLVSQHLQVAGGMLSLAFHQFSYASYDEACREAAICLPLTIASSPTEHHCWRDDPQTD